jgi:DNA-binding IclR family transcriptional regulator
MAAMLNHEPTDARIPVVIQRICHAFLETPRLELTAAQAERRFDLEPYRCRALLQGLVDAGFLEFDGGDLYRRRSL